MLGQLASLKCRNILKFPLGEEIPADGNYRTATRGYNSVRQKFTGYERDGESGLDYAQARYYSSAMGRFTGADPENAGAHKAAAREALDRTTASVPV